MEPMHHGPDSRPVPDPTELTRIALSREIASLRELLETRIDGIVSTRDARLDGMAEAVRLLQVARDKNPAELEQRLEQLMQLMNQRFLTVDERLSSIQTQFAERDTRGEREARDNKVAVDAAFAAQAAAAAKEGEANQKAIDKSERAVAETLNKQSDLFQSTTDALSAQISDIKERLTRIEGMGLGTRETNASRQTSNSFVLSLFVAGISLMGFVALMVERVAR